MTEVILALGATVDGATTAHWLTDRLKPLRRRVTRVAQGVPIGGALDVLDDGTLAAALRRAGRRDRFAPRPDPSGRQAGWRGRGLPHHGGDGPAADPRGLCRPAPLPPGKGAASSSSAPGSRAWCSPGNCARPAMRPLILEARDRAGGRNWSLRGGDEIHETTSVQRVAWDAGAAHVSQPRPGAAAVPPPGHPVLLPRARRAARGDEQRQPRRAAAQSTPRSKAGRSATGRWSTTFAATSPNWRRRRWTTTH